MRYILLFLSIIALSLHSHTLSANPFLNIEFHTLSNGLTLVIAPSSEAVLTRVQVDVGVGHFHEREGEIGVSHLLEHALFRDSRLKDNNSYMQVVKEAKGTINATTGFGKTSYFGSIKKDKSLWLLKIFHRMIFDPTLDERDIETEKNTVLHEIGNPSPLERIFKTNLSQILNPQYLKTPGYWESEFGVKFHVPYTKLDRQLSNISLLPSQVKQHYQRYYDPSNIRITISGGFDREEILSFAQEMIGTIKSNGMGEQFINFKATPAKRAYRRQSVQVGMGYIQLGHLVWDLGAKERVVLQSYTNYLVHRLLKEMRNLKGGTYSVRTRNFLEYSFGNFGIGFSSTRETFDQNLKMALDMLVNEAERGGLTKKQTVEAKELFLNRFGLWGKSADGMSRLAGELLVLRKNFNHHGNPFEILEGVSSSEYSDILKKYAQQDYRILITKGPELLFRYDNFVIMGVVAIFTMVGFRRRLMKSINNLDIRWMRKVKYPPLKMVEIVVGILGFVAFLHINYLLNLTIFHQQWFRALGVSAEYISSIARVFLVVAVFQFIISFLPRKLFVLKDRLVVKSLSYYSTHIKLSDITSVSSCSLMAILLNFRWWPKMWRSFFYFNPLFYKKGLLVELRSGRILVFSTKDSTLVESELKILIREQKPSDHHEVEYQEAG